MGIKFFVLALKLIGYLLLESTFCVSGWATYIYMTNSIYKTASTPPLFIVEILHVVFFSAFIYFVALLSWKSFKVIFLGGFDLNNPGKAVSDILQHKSV